MKNKAQELGSAPIVIMVILGLVAIITTSLSTDISNTRSINKLRTKDLIISDFSNLKQSVQTYVKDCINEGIINILPDTGIKETTKAQFKELLLNQVNSCMQDLVGELKDENFNVINNLNNIEISFKEDAIVAKLDYELVFEKEGQTTEFNEFIFVFDTVRFERSHGLVLKPRSIISPDGRAEFSFFPGTFINAEFLGIKIEDRNFDGLQNNVVVGNLVYSGLDDGTRFTRPIEVRIEFRDQDLNGYPKEKLSIAWWDKEYQVWRALNTRIEDNNAYAQAIHFTKFAIVKECAPIELQTQKIIDSPTLFVQRYEPCNRDYWTFSNGKIFAVDNNLVFPTQSHEQRIFWQGTCSPTVMHGTDIMKGYSDYTCVSGHTVDADGDGLIYFIDLKAGGNACLRQWSYNTICSIGDRCITSVEELATGTNTRLAVRSISVENTNRDACASGKVRFRIQGTGFNQV